MPPVAEIAHSNEGRIRRVFARKFQAGEIFIPWRGWQPKVRRIRRVAAGRSVMASTAAPAVSYWAIVTEALASDLPSCRANLLMVVSSRVRGVGCGVCALWHFRLGDRAAMQITLAPDHVLTASGRYRR